MTMALNHKIITLLNTGSMGLVQLSAELGDDGLHGALEELIAEGSIKSSRSRGEYRVSKERMILDILDDNGPCSYEFLQGELKASKRLSRGALHLMDVEVYSLLSRGMIWIDSRAPIAAKCEWITEESGIMMEFIHQIDGDIKVRSGGVHIGYLRKGGKTGFFTDRKSFSGSELMAIAEKLKEIQKD